MMMNMVEENMDIAAMHVSVSDPLNLRTISPGNVNGIHQISGSGQLPRECVA